MSASDAGIKPVGKKIRMDLRQEHGIGPKEKALRGSEVHLNKWVELFPYAISMGPMQKRPVLIFRDKSENLNLPVWLNHIEASIAALEISKNTNFHALTYKLLQGAEIEIRRCEFVEIQGYHQFVRLEISGHPKIKEIRVRADEAIPICMAMKARFFSTQEFIMRCRDLDVALLGLEQSLNLQPEFDSKKQPYMM